MSTPDGSGAGGALPASATPLTTQLPRPNETPSLPSATSATPGVALAGVRVPGAPTLPELDPTSLSRVIAQMANELFAAPVPPSPAPTFADAEPLSSPPSFPSPPASAYSAPLPGESPRGVPTSASTPDLGRGASPAPFGGPIDFGAVANPVDPFFATDGLHGLSFPLLDAHTPDLDAGHDAHTPDPDPRTPTRAATPDPYARDVRSPEPSYAAAPQGESPARTEPTFDQYEIVPTREPSVSEPSARSASNKPFDANVLKREFPILSEPVRGKRLVWLDNGATTQKPQTVIDRVSYFYEHENSNIHRAAHTLAARASDAYEAARESVRRFIKAPSARDIIFVRGATEGINLIAQSWGRRNIAAGDEIVISWLEHHANIVPWQRLCAEKGAKLRVAPVDDRGQVIVEEYEKLFNDRTKLVSFTQVSNALGTVTPAREMIDIAHRHGAVVVLDGAQAVSHMPVDVQALGCDFFVFSGHKVFAPTGIGAVFGRSELLDAMPPWQGGGNMIQDVTFERTLYQPPPARFEAGTGNIADAVGLGAALDWLSNVGVERVERYEHELLEYATGCLQGVPGLTLIGTAPGKAGVLSFVLRGQKTEEVGGILDQDGIAVRSGHHCAQPILRRFGLEATVRASLAPYNTFEDIDALVSALHRLQVGKPR